MSTISQNRHLFANVYFFITKYSVVVVFVKDPLRYTVRASQVAQW